MPRALITGITGQDGWYLSELLRESGHEVYGLVVPGDPQALPDGAVGIEGDSRDTGSLVAALETAQPDVIYNLASISSVADSWAHPELAADINGVGTLRLLAAIHDKGSPIRFVQASSAEVFGDAPAPQDEQTPIRPVSPYGAAKAFAQHAVSAYRAAGVWAAAAILYNHESPRRPDKFVTRKITATVARIADGSDENLVLGNLDARRDWGYARDYMQAMTLMAGQAEPCDYVIATGVSHTVRDFVAAAFTHVGISDWESRVTSDPAFTRATDAGEQRGDATKIRRELGWAPSIDFASLVGLMVDTDLEIIRNR
jgi:GDPmannose 4,6-dehydratase